MLAGGIIELGPSDNVALDQPRVAIELIKDTGATAHHYDFGTNNSPVESGFVRRSTGTFNGSHGWQPGATLGSVDRAVGSDLNRDFVSVSVAQATFSRTLPNGTYQVQVHLGDLVDPHDEMAVWFEGETSSAHPWIDTAAGQVIVKSYTVAVTDGRLDVHFQDMGGSDDQLALIALEMIDLGHGSGTGWASVGPGVFNTFLLDTGANSVLAMASAVGDMEQPPVAYQTQGTFREVGVAGYHDMDISVDYRFDFAGTSGIRHTLFDTRIQSDANNDFSIFGPWGLAGMPAMAGRVTTLDMTGWSGGEVALEDIYMKTDFSEDMAEADLNFGGSNEHRYALAVDNRLAFDPMDYMVDPVNDEPPVWADIPFLTAIPTQNGVGREGNFLLDTGAQISVISEQLALQLGLDSNGNGLLDEGDDNYVTTESVGGVGGTVPAPVFTIDEVHVPVKKVLPNGELGEEVELVWTNLQWLVLDIETDEATTLDGVFGSDLLTSGWFYSFFYGLEDGYFDRVHFDFQDWGLYNGTPEPRQGTVYFDLNPLKDQPVDPGPGIRVRHSGGSTQVAENGGTDTYTVVLTGEPAADVTVQLANTDGQVRAENQANGNNTLVFTPSNWDVAQTVLVTGEDDSLAEGPHTGTITHTVTSSDPAYDGLAVPDMEVSIADDDVSVVTITSDQAGNNVIESLNVSEGGGTVTYWLRLSSPPAEDSVVIIEDIAGGSQVHISNPDSWGIDNWWVFLAGEWDHPQPVEVTALNDSYAEGPHQVQLVHTLIDGLTTVGQTVLPVNITDDDLGHVTITETNQSTLVVEGADTDTYQIALDLAPVGGPVEITVTAGSQLELSADGGTTYGSSLVLSFTDLTPQTVTVRAFDDSLEEGSHTGRITHAITGTVFDPRYPTALPIQSVSATILDNDAAGIIISEDAAGENVVTSIAAVEGADVNYWVALNSQPSDNVTVYLESSSEQVTIVDAANPTHAYLEFTPQNATTPQAIRVSTIDDGIPEEAETAQITFSAFSADPQYQGSTVSTMTVSDPVVAQASVVGRHIFYDNSYWDGYVAGRNDVQGGTDHDEDDDAIAPDKEALVGDGVTPATALNYTNFSGGITGIMVDISGLADPAGIDVTDFVFKFGNDDTPDDWTVADDSNSHSPASVSTRDLGGGVTRVTITWDRLDGPATSHLAVPTRNWLQVSVLAGADTGLANDDVFYFGNSAGDANYDGRTLQGDWNTVFPLIHPVNIAPLTSVADIDRSGKVLQGDRNPIVANVHPVARLEMIVPPESPPAGGTALLAGFDPQPLRDTATNDVLMDQLSGELAIALSVESGIRTDPPHVSLDQTVDSTTRLEGDTESPLWIAEATPLLKEELRVSRRAARPELRANDPKTIDLAIAELGEDLPNGFSSLGRFFAQKARR